MVDFQPRIITSFESTDGGTILTFPLAEYEWESSQDLDVPSAEIVGANYSYDQLGSGPPIKKDGRETLRFLVFEDDPATVDSDVDDIIAKCVSIGRGRLYTTDRNGAKRWAYARAVSLPQLRWQAGDIFSKTASIEFRRQSDWYNATQTTVSQSVTASPTSFTVANGGTQRVWNALITLKGTWTGPVVITNETTGYSFTYDGGDAGTTSDDWVRFDAGAGRCYRSYDGGTTWSDADANLTLGNGQVQQMRIDPGNNTFTVTDGGSPSATLDVAFYAPH